MKKKDIDWCELQEICAIMINNEVDYIDEDGMLVLTNFKLAIKLLKQNKESGGVLFVACMKIYNDFIFEKIGVRAKIDALAGKSLKEIIAYLKSLDKIKEDADVIKAFQFIFVHYDKWGTYEKTQTKLNQINYNLQNILNSIRNGTKLTAKTDREKRRDSIDEIQQRAIKLLESD